MNHAMMTKARSRIMMIRGPEQDHDDKRPGVGCTPH